MHADSVPVVTKQEVAREKGRHKPITSTQRGNPPVEQGREVTYCANLNCGEDWPCTAYRLCEWYEATLVETPHTHDRRPLGFTPHPTSGGLMPTDGCACGARRYPYSPEVKRSPGYSYDGDRLG